MRKGINICDYEESSEEERLNGVCSSGHTATSCTCTGLQRCCGRITPFIEMFCDDVSNEGLKS